MNEEKDKDNLKKESKYICPKCGSEVKLIGVVGNILYGKCTNKKCIENDKENRGYYRLQTANEFKTDIEKIEGTKKEIEEKKELEKEIERRQNNLKNKQFELREPNKETIFTKEDSLFNKILKISVLVIIAVFVVGLIYFLILTSQAVRDGQLKPDIHIESNPVIDQSIVVNNTQTATTHVNIPIDNFVIENETIINNSSG